MPDQNTRDDEQKKARKADERKAFMEALGSGGGFAALGSAIGSRIKRKGKRENGRGGSR